MEPHGPFHVSVQGGYSPTECLNLYRDRDQVEKAFEILKSDFNIFPLRGRKQSTIWEMVFIPFISLILRLSKRRDAV
ncbi:MAG: transposase [Thermoplasmatales archaeon]